jgi:hypothetical protein
MQNINLAVAFILEVIAFAAFTGSGALLPVAVPLRIILSVLFFSVLVVFWSLYMSPKAPKKFKTTSYYGSKFIIYGLAAVVIAQTQNQFLGLLFVFAVIVNEMLLFKHNTL